MKTFFLLVFISIISCFAQASYALSTYGPSCEQNNDCVTCNKDLKCERCLHACWNKYGDPENPAIPCPEGDQWCIAKYKCTQRQSKWCYTQCWDPDDTSDPDYVTTKPDCMKYLKPKQSIIKKSD